LAKLDASISAQQRGRTQSQDKQQAAKATLAHAPVVLVPAPHPAMLEVEHLLRQCSEGKSRSGGPGGQNRNKVETTVTITHVATAIAAHAGERRTVMENRRVALSRLRLALAVQARAPVASGDVRSALWRARCRHAKIVVSPRHEDFAAMLAEAMDMIFACDMDVKMAAARLACSISQLIKLLKDHPPAFAAVNVQRAARGLGAMK
jgi:hypothetical protein